MYAKAYRPKGKCASLSAPPSGSPLSPACYVDCALGLANRGLKLAVICALQLAALAIAGCGSQSAGGNASEPAGTYQVSVVGASFPVAQSLAQKSQMMISVQNTGQKAAPNVAVTVKSFDRPKQQPDLADPRRPVFIVDQSPPGSATAFTDTYALGPLSPGQTKTFTWQVTAVQPGPFSIDYVVAAGLSDKVHAVDSSGRLPSGTFSGSIYSQAPPATVGPSGQVMRSR